MRLPRRSSLADLPVMLCGLLLSVGSVLLIAQVAMGALWHGKQMKLSATLFGVMRPPETVAISIPNLLNGSYQAALAEHIGTRQPYYATAIRLRNQVQYSIFHASALPDIMVGHGWQLLETPYVTDYCTRNLAAFMVTAPRWATQIRQMQNEVERRGQTFLYVLTPSKLAQYPDYLPSGIPCPSSAADRAGIVPAWMALVNKNGINVVDTTAIMSAAHYKYPFPLYPQGGIHWNAVGGALAAQAVEANLEQQRRDGSFLPFTFTWKLSSHPVSVDADLASLMNLFWPPLHYTVPNITEIQAEKPANCHPLKVVIVGGSFAHNIGDALSRLPCGVQVTEYEYWTAYHITWNGKQTLQPYVDASMRNADLRSADVIIYEENEQILGHSRHGLALYRWLSGG